jgi:hypothetical protein
MSGCGGSEGDEGGGSTAAAGGATEAGVAPTGAKGKPKEG